MEFLQQNWYWAALAAISGAWLMADLIRNRGDKSQLSPIEATLLINREDAQVIDVRGSDEYVSGHLPDSRNIPLEQLEARAGELEKFKDTPVILVCQTGARSSGACKQLEKLGFTKVNNLDSGIAGWRSAGLPLKKGAKK